jgi:hypothetical protein
MKVPETQLAFMKRTLLFTVFAAAFVLPYQQSFAQTGKIDSLFAKGDTTAVMDSLMNGFDAFLDSLARPKSFFTVSVGIGNRTFSIKNNSLNTQEATTDNLSLTPAIGYYHKSGLGLSITGFLSTLNDKLSFYQYAITPSYDYISRKISAGVSYTRYFGKDTSTLNASPYEHDLYGYFNIHHDTWRYGISAGYSTGTFSDKLSYKDSILRFNNVLQRLEWFYYKKTVNSTNKLKDISLSVSVRKDIEWYKIFTKDDNLTLSIISYLVAGSSKIKTSTDVNLATRKINLARFRRSYQSMDGNGFQLQSAALSASLFYSIGKFNLQPVWFMDYYFPDSDKKISEVFSFTVGFNF